MNYEEQTNADLKQLCEDLDLEVKAKNPSKPNKAELIAALNEYDGVTPEVVEEIVQDESPEVESKGTLNKAQLRRHQHREKMKLVRVMATSNADNQTKVDLITISWGNDLLGYHTDRLLLGKPWHIRQGALDNLRATTITKPVQNEEQNKIDYNQIPAYNVQDLGLLSKDEYKALGEKQKVRDAAVSAQ